MKAPSPPDPKETAGAQTANNVATAVANARLGAVDQVTPYGTLNYSQTGTTKFTDPNTGAVYDIPSFSVEQQLSDNQQQILDNTEQAQITSSALAGEGAERLRSHLASDFSAPSTYRTDWSEDRQRVEDALMSRLNPQLERDKETLRTSLVNQGIREGSEAFDRAMNRANEQSNDARMQAILAGGEEQSRLAGLDAARTGFEAQMAFANRNQPINEMGALLGTGQVTQPSFITPNMPNIPTTDRAGLEMDAYRQRLGAWQQKQAMMGGLLGTGATLLGAPQGSILGGFL